MHLNRYLALLLLTALSTGASAEIAVDLIDATNSNGSGYKITPPMGMTKIVGLRKATVALSTPIHLEKYVPASGLLSDFYAARCWVKPAGSTTWNPPSGGAGALGGAYGLTAFAFDLLRQGLHYQGTVDAASPANVYLNGQAYFAGSDTMPTYPAAPLYPVGADLLNVSEQTITVYDNDITGANVNFMNALEATLSHEFVHAGLNACAGRIRFLTVNLPGTGTPTPGPFTTAGLQSALVAGLTQSWDLTKSQLAMTQAAFHTAIDAYYSAVAGPHPKSHTFTAADGSKVNCQQGPDFLSPGAWNTIRSFMLLDPNAAQIATFIGNSGGPGACGDPTLNIQSLVIDTLHYSY
jgi:hypothetical protein